MALQHLGMLPSHSVSAYTPTLHPNLAPPHPCSMPLSRPQADVPFSRLMSLARPEWHYGVLGMISSGGAGAVQPLFAFTLASFIIVFFKPIVSLLGLS